MRTSRVTRAASFVALLPLFLAIPSRSQRPPNASPEPSDPKALMLAAAKANDLVADDIQPWHIKASFVTFDDQGKPKDRGTYEEYWAGPAKDKMIFSGPDYSRVDTHTAAGLLRSAMGTAVPSIAAEARREFVEPLPTPAMIEHEGFDLEQRQSGDSELACLKITGLSANPRLEYCLATDKPALRLSNIGFESLQVIHNRLVSFQGHYIAGDLQFLQAGKVIGTAHLESIDALVPVSETAFQPSPNSKLVPLRIGISPKVAGAMLLEHRSPEYPPQAIAAKIQGTVVVSIVIGTDGHVSELHVVSGPPILQQPAIDAVRGWIYRPYLLNGNPVQVNSTAYVVFYLENRVPTVQP